MFLSMTPAHVFPPQVTPPLQRISACPKPLRTVRPCLSVIPCIKRCAPAPYTFCIRRQSAGYVFDFSVVYALLCGISLYFPYDSTTYAPRFQHLAHSCTENRGGRGACCHNQSFPEWNESRARHFKEHNQECLCQVETPPCDVRHSGQTPCGETLPGLRPQ